MHFQFLKTLAKFVWVNYFGILRCDGNLIVYSFDRIIDTIFFILLGEMSKNIYIYIFDVLEHVVILPFGGRVLEKYHNRTDCEFVNNVMNRLSIKYNY